MKIIARSNFDNESVSDILVAENLLKDCPYARFIVKALNARFGGHFATYFFKLVKDDYNLYKFVP